MSAIRMFTDELPAAWRMEVWGDSTVWIVSPAGERLRLREYLRRRIDDPYGALDRNQLLSRD